MDFILGLYMLVAAAPPHLPPGDAARGELLYAHCQQCHSLDKNGVGPRHRGVFDRAAGTQPGYVYSQALKERGIIWNEANLDAWLNGPQTLVPGVAMTYYLANAQDRADIIAFLRTRAR